MNSLYFPFCQALQERNQLTQMLDQGKTSLRKYSKSLGGLTHNVMNKPTWASGQALGQRRRQQRDQTQPGADEESGTDYFERRRQWIENYKKKKDCSTTYYT